MALEPGSLLGPYEILAPVGAGGMGQVYRAKDRALGRDVAVKVLREEFSSDPERLHRFKQEARSASALNHPNIVTIYDIDRHGDRPYIAMEFVEGSTLRAVLSAGPLPLERVLRYATQIAGGLAKAHGAGIVHRDLKPENLMLTSDGFLKILDFGLAKLLSEQGLDPETGTRTTDGTGAGVVVGTMNYMSPEQALGTSLDARTDVFSFGVVLYEMVTGRRPFPEQHGGRLIEAVLHAVPPMPSRLRPDVPGGLEGIILKCLEKDPGDRYPSARELEEDLLRLAIPASAVQGPVRRSWSWMVPAAAAAVVGLGLSSAYWPRTRMDRPASLDAPRSIAVLPFVDMSRDKDQEYFSDGLAEELISDLNKIPGLQVVGRTSSFQFKGKNEDLRVIGEKLNVTSLLEGSVRTDGKRLRIAAQLINAADGFHLWSETYDRELDDIFVVQAEIARSVAGALRVTLLDAAEPTSGTRSTEAYTAYLMGGHFYRQVTKESLEKAADYYRKAIQLDPAFARAWTGLGYVRAYQAGTGYVPTDEGYREAIAAVENALRMAPNLPSAHAVLGWIRMSYNWDFAGADAAYRKARALEPGRGVVEGAQLALAFGRLEEAQQLAHMAVRDDPLSSQAQFTLGIVDYYSGRLAEAAADFRTLLQRSPEFPNVHALLGLICLEQSRADEALAEVSQEKEPYRRLPALAMVAHALGRSRDSDDALAAFTREFQAVAALQIAEVHAVRGETDLAVRWLERAYEQRDGGLFLMKTDPLLKNLKRDPRYLALLEKMRLPR